MFYDAIFNKIDIANGGATQSIVSVLKKCFKSNFTGKLSDPQLTYYLLNILRKNGFAITAKIDEKIVGVSVVGPKISLVRALRLRDFKNRWSEGPFSKDLVRRNNSIINTIRNTLLNALSANLNRIVYRSNCQGFYISYICVLNEKRGHGLGGKLLSKSLDLAAKSGEFSSIWCFVEARSESTILFYQKNGFTVVGIGTRKIAYRSLRNLSPS